jgi:hypothetical protein
MMIRSDEDEPRARSLRAHEAASQLGVTRLTKGTRGAL